MRAAGGTRPREHLPTCSPLKTSVPAGQRNHAMPSTRCARVQKLSETYVLRRLQLQGCDTGRKGQAPVHGPRVRRTLIRKAASDTGEESDPDVPNSGRNPGVPGGLPVRHLGAGKCWPVSHGSPHDDPSGPRGAWSGGQGWEACSRGLHILSCFLPSEAH